MIIPTLPTQEKARLAALHHYQILDTEAEPFFDEITQLASRVCDTPFALITLVDADRQWFKSTYGWEQKETSREVAFCTHTILGPQPLIVPDASTDPRFSSNPLVTGEPNIRFYTGIPLTTPEGYHLGSLCVLDQVTRTLTEMQVKTLQFFAKQIMSWLENQLQDREPTPPEHLMQRQELSVAWPEVQENRLRHIINSVSIYFGIFSLEGRVRHLNASGLAQDGYTLEEMVVKPFWETAYWSHSAAEREKLQDAFRRVLRGESIRYDTSCVNNKGEIFFLDVLFFPLYDEQSQMIEIVGTGVDITERVEVNRKLIEEKQRLELALWAADLGMWDWNVVTGSVLFNDKYAAILGYTTEELPHTADTWQNLLHPTDKQRVLLALQKHLSGETPFFQAEQRLLSKSGEWKWILSRGRVIDRDEQGNPVRVIGMHQDITARKQAEAETEELRLRLEGIFASATDAILIINQSQNIILANHATSRMFGHQDKDLRNLPLSTLIPEELIRQHILPTYPDQGSSGPAAQAGGFPSLVGLHTSGEPFPLEASISHFQVTGQRYLTIILRDISQRIAAEMHLQQLNQELLQHNQQLQQFAFVTSHNLRAPVANLLGLAGVFNQKQPADPFNQQVIHSIGKEAQRLDTVIRDLNQLLSMRYQPLKLEPIQLDRILELVFLHLEQPLAESEGKVRVDFSAAPTVMAVKSYLESILVNLLSNAIKYRSPQRPLQIRLLTRREESYIVLSVEDNGLGIDLKKHQEKLFGLYKRFHSHQEGKGLGLHLVKTQIEAMGGKVSVDSQVDRGTKLEVYFQAFSKL